MGGGSEWGRHVKDSQGTRGTAPWMRKKIQMQEIGLLACHLHCKNSVWAPSTPSPLLGLESGTQPAPGPVGHLGGNGPTPAATDMGGGNNGSKAYASS